MIVVNVVAKEIIMELSNYLPPMLVIELKLSFAVRPSITICCTVDRIIKKYNSNEKDEKIVTKLLEKLLQIHFSS